VTNDPDSPRRHYIRFDPDQSGKELEEAVLAWVEAILGPPPDDVHSCDPRPPCHPTTTDVDRRGGADIGCPM
jgi:hypothetical protein